MNALQLMCICELLLGPKVFITRNYLGDEVATPSRKKGKCKKNVGINYITDGNAQVQA